MDTQAAAPPLATRRYGGVNWLGLKTLTQREIQRFLKVGLQTVFAPLVQTLLFMMVFGLVLRDGNWPGTERAYADGLAAGLVMMSILSNAFQNSSSSIVIAKVQGNAVDFLMPPLSALELAIAFIVGAAARGILVGAASLLAVSWLANITPIHPLAAIYYGVVASIMFGAIGLIGGIWSDKFDHIAAVTNFIVVPLTFLSGTFYSTDVLPEPFRTFAHWNPVFFLIDGFRFGFIGHHDAPILTGALISGGLALALCWVCWAMLKSGYRLRS
ncbi:MAG: ABC transporter permease [Hyphomonadaceae bacterium]|nr:ABC transporter permease [Hyphomonadaceae bacterium]GIK47624.1 MAG: transport permease protein [Alphaproteobacteria bacterium]